MLNQRIEIYRMVDTPDGAGGNTSVETLYWSTNAMVTPWRSNNAIEANQETLQDGFKFLARYRDDKSVKADMRIKYRGGWLKIINNPLDYVYKEYIEFNAIWQSRPTGNE